ncbi:MAG: DUF6046 domain-containing protein [Flavobacteriales bacterium]
MSVIIDLGVRYAAAFGMFSKQNQEAIVLPEGNAYNFEFFENGNNSFEDLSLSWLNKEVNFGSLPFNKSIGNILAPPPFITFNREKKLNETPINDSDAYVIERWNTKAYKIRLRGLLIDVDNRTYPEGLVKELHKLFEYNGVIDVEGVQFEDKDIHHLVFKSILFSGVKGFQDTIQYSIEARAIRSVGFTLLNP